LTTTEELPPVARTLCAVRVPHGPHDPTAHVVMFSLGGEFAGAVRPYGARVPLCLLHGDDVLTARRTLPDGSAFGTGRYRWLTPGRDHLPVPSLTEHDRPVSPRATLRPAYSTAARTRRTPR
jgi:hypothetical protein